MPKYIRRGKPVEDIYNLTSRQQKRLVAERRLSHYHPSGDHGPCWLSVEELDAIFEAGAKPALSRSRKA